MENVVAQQKNDDAGKGGHRVALQWHRPIPKHDVANAVHHVDEGIELQVGPRSRRDFIDWVEYGASEKQGHGHELRSVAQVFYDDPDGGKEHPNSGGGNEHYRQHCEYAEMSEGDRFAEQEGGDDDESGLYRESEERGEQAGDDQGLERENDFLDEGRIRLNQGRGEYDDLGEEVVQSEADEDPQCVLQRGLAFEAAAEDVAENEGIDSKHQERGKQGPDDS